MLEPLFNKVECLTTWRPVTLLERHSSTDIFLWISWKFQERFFAEHLLATTSNMMFFFSFLQISEVYSRKTIYLVEQWQIKRRNSRVPSILCSYENQTETSLTQRLLPLIQIKRSIIYNMNNVKICYRNVTGYFKKVCKNYLWRSSLLRKLQLASLKTIMSSFRGIFQR